MKLNKIERGQCLLHGYVIERCCALFEPLKTKPFLRLAIDRVRVEADEDGEDDEETIADAEAHREDWQDYLESQRTSH